MKLKSMVFAAALVAIASCDKSPTAPAYPQVAGTYTSASFLTIRVVDPATGVTTNTEVCPGNVTIQQSDATLTGTVVMNVPAGDRDCPFNGTLTQGAVDTDGKVSFGLAVTGVSGNLWTVTECTVVSGASTFTGTITGNTLAASVAAVLNCGGSSNINVTLQLAGSR